MWNANNQTMNLEMAEGDYGIELPVTLNGTTLTSSDCIKFTFKDSMNGTTILEKELTNPVQNTVKLVFTAQESALFEVGCYVYSMDWYQSGAFMCNIIEGALFKVVDKA